MVIALDMATQIIILLLEVFQWLVFYLLASAIVLLREKQVPKASNSFIFISWMAVAISLVLNGLARLFITSELVNEISQLSREASTSFLFFLIESASIAIGIWFIRQTYLDIKSIAINIKRLFLSKFLLSFAFPMFLLLINGAISAFAFSILSLSNWVSLGFLIALYVFTMSRFEDLNDLISLRYRDLLLDPNQQQKIKSVLTNFMVSWTKNLSPHHSIFQFRKIAKNHLNQSISPIAELLVAEGIKIDEPLVLASEAITFLGDKVMDEIEATYLAKRKEALEQAQTISSLSQKPSTYQDQSARSTREKEKSSTIQKERQLQEERRKTLERMIKRTRKISISDFMRMLKFNDRGLLLEWLYQLPEGMMLLDGDYIVFQGEGVSDQDLSQEIDELLQKYSTFEREKLGKV